jgi:8-oxo-dGTP pyrophosphatase MutT (NUDIX family)
MKTVENQTARAVKSAPMKTEPFWAPHITVAAIIERDERFLVVEEHADDGLRINQPAGHLEAGESLIDAAIRETLEETAHPFTPEALVGVYMWHGGKPTGENGGTTYLRFAFCGISGKRIENRPLDSGIVRALWLTPSELRACRERHRSPLVMQCVDDYLAGRRFPLDLIHTHSVKAALHPQQKPMP